MSTQVKKCSCKSEFQDKEYGKDMRLLNENEKGGGACTVCGAVQRVDKEKK
jgi:hypothetical protein